MTNIHKLKSAVDSQEMQSNILRAFQREKSELTIWLMNQASPIIGRIKRFDVYTITVSGNDGKYHMLYKHGIAGFSVEAEIFRNMKFRDEKEAAVPQAIPPAEAAVEGKVA